MGKSKVFLGSSAEGKNVAHRLAVDLDRSELTESTPWTHGVFSPGQHVLGTLVEQARTADFAIMVLSPDDDVESRSSKAQAPRDNVVFELGLFTGSLGPERTYMVLPSGVDLKLPSDLAGITYLTYRTREDGNMAAALSGVTIEVIDAIKKLGPRGSDFTTQLPSGPISSQNLENDLRTLGRNLIPQGWTFKWNEARTTLRVRSPRGTQHVLKIGQPSKMPADFDQFVRELRSQGARFDSNLRQG